MFQIRKIVFFYLINLFDFKFSTVIIYIRFLPFHEYVTRQLIHFSILIGRLEGFILRIKESFHHFQYLLHSCLNLETGGPGNIWILSNRLHYVVHGELIVKFSSNQVLTQFLTHFFIFQNYKGRQSVNSFDGSLGIERRATDESV